MKVLAYWLPNNPPSKVLVSIGTIFVGGTTHESGIIELPDIPEKSVAPRCYNPSCVIPPSECRCNLTRSDSHPVETKSVPPSTKEPEDSGNFPAFPKTHQEIDNFLSYLSIGRLEKAVGQWLAEGSVTSLQSQTLLSHLNALAQQYGTLRLGLLKILDDRLRKEAGVGVGKK